MWAACHAVCPCCAAAPGSEPPQLLCPGSEQDEADFSRKKVKPWLRGRDATVITHLYMRPQIQSLRTPMTSQLW